MFYFWVNLYRVISMKKYYLLFIVLVFLLGACSENRKQPKREFSEKLVKSTVEEINEIIDNIRYLFPSPAEIFDIIYKKNVKYNSDLLNSRDNASLYNDVRLSYTNLGIYLSDMVYCVFMEQNNEALEYLKTVKNMGSDLKALPESMNKVVSKAEKNINNVDSLIDITNYYFFESLKELEDKNMHKAVAMMTAGAYIEVLYIACNSVESYSDDHPIINKIIQQRYAIENLKNYAAIFRENEIAKDTYLELLEIKEAFLKFGEIQEETKLEKKGDGTLVIHGGVNIQVSEKDFNNLKRTVTEIRNDLVDTK